MSADGNATALEFEPATPASERFDAEHVWGAIERALERIGDRLNPILVKETRQALKSKQFLITFGLLLILGWGWSILGIIQAGPGAAFGAFGWQLFYGYYVILAFPLLIVVPFGAFRSLAAEQETRTFELLSITALGTRQIVLGKLGSAVLQMTVYLSAIAPCLGFTYLLRGIDMPTIAYVMFWLTLASLGFSMIGLLLATVATKKQFQVLPMLAAAIGCCFGFYLSLVLGYFFVEREATQWLADSYFWPVNGIILTAFLGYFVLLCEAAAARLSFASDNRSTRLRIIMVLHQFLFTAWMTFIWLDIHGRFVDFYFVFLIMAGIQWYLLGALMVGESPILFSRVKRQLPKSFLGRVFLTWFFPGPGKGYMLALTGLICSFLSACIGFAVAEILGWNGNGRMNFIDHVLPFAVLGIGYVTVYLGLGLLIVKFIRRFAPVGQALSVLMQILLILLGCIAPVLIQWIVPDLHFNSSYSILHITNPFWSLLEVAEGRQNMDLPIMIALVSLAAAVVFAMNLRGLYREIETVRVYRPKRVIDEDVETKGMKAAEE
jgi:hypothetical protein